MRPALSALLLVGCTYAKSETTVADIEGPVAASLVRVDRRQIGVDAIGGGHVGILVPAAQTETDCELRVTKPKILTIDVPRWCDGVSLQADPSGQRLAYGVPGAWEYLFFAASGRSFDGLAPITTDAVDWALIRAVERQTYAWRAAPRAAWEQASDGAAKACTAAAAGEPCAAEKNFLAGERLCTSRTSTALNEYEGKPYGEGRGVLHFDDRKRLRWTEGDPAPDGK